MLPETPQHELPDGFAWQECNFGEMTTDKDGNEIYLVKRIFAVAYRACVDAFPEKDIPLFIHQEKEGITKYAPNPDIVKVATRLRLEGVL